MLREERLAGASLLVREHIGIIESLKKYRGAAHRQCIFFSGRSLRTSRTSPAPSPLKKSARWVNDAATCALVERVVPSASGAGNNVYVSTLVCSAVLGSDG